MKIIICLFLIGVSFNDCIGQQIKKDSLHRLLLGEWYSIDDTSYHMNFSKNFVREYIWGLNGIDTFSYSIQKHSCDPMLGPGQGTGYFLAEIGKDKYVYCYFIRDISEDYLELVYASGRTLYFRKFRSK
jgi:hypothetical protein